MCNKKNILLGGIGILFLVIEAWGANLVITRDTNTVYDGGTYDKLYVGGCHNVTIRNCSFSSNQGAVANLVQSNYITIENCDMNGMFVFTSTNPKIGTGACTGLSVSGQYNTIKNCNIHDVADDGLTISGTGHKIIGTTISHLMGCGTDNGCGPCGNGHSDGVELNKGHDIQFIGNLIFDVRSTSAFFMLNSGTKSSNISLINNIFYTPGSGYVAYLRYVNGLNLYNNIMWKGKYGAINFNAGGLSGIKMYNNIFQKITGSYSAQKGNNLIGTDPKFKKIPHYTSSTTYTTVTADDFSLTSGSPAINAGKSDGGVPTTDFYGNPRTAPFDIGAIEFGSTSTPLVTIDPNGGTYTGFVQVSLSTNSGFTIFYTTDGNTPTQNSTEYTEIITLTQSATLKTKSFKDAESSPVASASFTITTDTQPPTITGVNAGSDKSVVVTYNEAVEKASAENTGNYSIDNGVSISAAVLGGDSKMVTLTTATLSEGITYTLTVNSVKDRASTANTIAANSTGTFSYFAQLIFSNLTVTSGKAYEWDTAANGKLIYLDRSYAFSSLPAAYIGLDFLRAANDDKGATGNSFLSFDVNQPVTVYVAHHDLISTKPSWLGSFTDNGDNITVSGATHSIFAKQVSAGTVTLGGNAGGSRSMYVILVKASSITGVKFSQELIRNVSPVLAISPNPSKSMFNFLINPLDLNKVLSVKIYDLEGNSVKDLTLNAQGLALWDGTDQSNGPVAPGIYLYQISMDDNFHSGRIILLK